ncbi:MAG: hypothetical protein K5694_04695 [Bacilli bacterium]|nr:hypothetical protein [Bacilli bacterium]
MKLIDAYFPDINRVLEAVLENDLPITSLLLYGEEVYSKTEMDDYDALNKERYLVKECLTILLDKHQYDYAMRMLIQGISAECEFSSKKRSLNDYDLHSFYETAIIYAHFYQKIRDHIIVLSSFEDKAINSLVLICLDINAKVGKKSLTPMVYQTMTDLVSLFVVYGNDGAASSYHLGLTIVEEMTELDNSTFEDMMSPDIENIWREYLGELEKAESLDMNSLPIWPSIKERFLTYNIDSAC